MLPPLPLLLTVSCRTRTSPPRHDIGISRRTITLPPSPSPPPVSHHNPYSTLASLVTVCSPSTPDPRTLAAHARNVVHEEATCMTNRTPMTRPLALGNRITHPLPALKLLPALSTRMPPCASTDHAPINRQPHAHAVRTHAHAVRMHARVVRTYTRCPDAIISAPILLCSLKSRLVFVEPPCLA